MLFLYGFHMHYNPSEVIQTVYSIVSVLTVLAIIMAFNYYGILVPFPIQEWEWLLLPVYN